MIALGFQVSLSQTQVWTPTLVKTRTSLKQALVGVLDNLFSISAQALHLIQIPASRIALKTFAILRILLPGKSGKRVCVDWLFPRRR